MPVPTGTFTGISVDANGVAFYKSIGASDKMAELWGGCITDVTFTKTGPKRYNVHSVEPKSQLTQDFEFALDVEESNTPPSGITIKSIFYWDESSNTVQGRCSNSIGFSWSVNWIFRGDHLTLARTSAITTSLAEFRRL